jgi:hypothetical protein
LFGWFLGLIGPIILDHFRSRRRTQEIRAGLRVEMEDLQYRLAIASFLLVQRHGAITREFISWLKPVLDSYSGAEPSGGIRQWVDKLVVANDHELKEIGNHARAKEDMGSNLMLFQAGFLESHLAEISRLSISCQRKIHEFRNQLEILNQQISGANKYLEMTFNSSLTEGNHQIVTTELKKKYIFIQEREKITVDKIASVLEDI